MYQPKPDFNNSPVSSRGGYISRSVPISLGFIVDVKDEDLIKVSWYVENYLPHAKRQKDWIPASILEHAGTLRVISKNNLTENIKNGNIVKGDLNFER